MTEKTSAVKLEIQNSIAHISIDDGKVNALSPAVVGEIDSALSEAETNSQVVVISGREGIFCAGFDLKVIQGPSEGASALMQSGIDLFLKIFSFPKPIVAACTGHGIAAGAIILMCSDLRIGPDDEGFSIGLNEVSIGMEIPPFLVEIAAARLANERLHESLNLARLYTPREAVQAGFLDRLAPKEEVVDAALKEAQLIQENLDPEAFQKTKRRLRKDAAERIDESRK